MSQEIGKIKAIFRYPVKSMAGVHLDRAALGWHGVNGDRRFAFRRLADPSGFPWLSASRLPQLLLYKPTGEAEVDKDLPTHVRTPDGAELELHSADLQNEIAGRHGSPVQLMQLKHGVFDEAAVSLINMTTISGIEREADRPLDVLRFRPNILIDSHDVEPFAEDQWVGKTLRFGADDNSPAVSVTMRDLRCVMINLDPETAEADSRVMKAALRLNANYAGVYATVIRSGELRIDQAVYLV
ncbi:MAG TPA: MOSC N-terminal beta barrel domain-containing protein [Pyrinomonadaceae bacterium]|nr:MOSC N-terminal beta barrel domain-containing protein [Pyrinomonadaceae bacterium]